MRTMPLMIGVSLMLMAGVAHAERDQEVQAPRSDEVQAPRSAETQSPRDASNETVSEAQQALQAAGYYDGPADGVLSPETRAAISRFQEDKGRMPSGSLDGATAEDLQIGSAPSVGNGASASPTMSEPELRQSAPDADTVEAP